MSILVAGSIGYDSVRTPFGRRDGVLGGSATYFAVAASYLAPVSIISVVGEDFNSEDQDLLDAHQINTDGLTRADGETFRWIGEYGKDLNEANTIDTHLNVFADFKPKLDNRASEEPYLFLANIDPELQLQVLGQMKRRPMLVVGDTMDFWIEGKNRALFQVIRTLDTLIINRGEARKLTGETNLVKAAQAILRQGPSEIVVKSGEYGALGFNPSGVFSVPGYPLGLAVDPTGAGDSFAGGFVGYLAASGDLSMNGFRHAMIMGSVMASFSVESFGLERLANVSVGDVRKRYKDFWDITHFDSSGDFELPILSSNLGKFK
jgi:sugar/nucleoside kinase (ribokinase family)